MRVNKMLVATVLGLSLTLTGCGGGKPSKSEVVDGFLEASGDMGLPIPDDQLDPFAECFVDEVYDEVSDETLNAIADGDDEGGNKDDEQAVMDASQKCAEELVAQ